MAGNSKTGPKRHYWRTNRSVRDWQQGETPMPTELNSHRANSLVEGIFANLDIAEGLTEDDLQRSWATIAGDFVANQSEVISLKRGQLLLRVLQPTMRFHLEQSRGQLLAKLQASLGKDKVREIRLISG